MSLPSPVHATLMPSITDGKRFFVASLEEMPGIVAIGDSERDALRELSDALRDIQSRMNAPAVELLEPAVVAYQWCSYPSKGRPTVVASHNYPPVCPEGAVVDPTQELLAL